MSPASPNAAAASRDALVIFDGSLGSLCAAWATGIIASARVVAWVPPAVAADAHAEPIARQLAEACRGEFVHGSPVEWPGPPEVTAALAQTGTLLAAGLAAIQLGLSRAIWPIHHGQAPTPPSTSARTARVGAPPADLAVGPVAASFDRALLVSRLLSTDAGAISLAAAAAGGVRIETPYLELSTEQLADLAMDMDVPTALLSRVGVAPAGWGAGGASNPGSVAPGR